MSERIGVIGVGKLGLCFALAAADAGYEVIAMDTREDHIRDLQCGDYRSNEPGVNKLLAELRTPSPMRPPLIFTTDLAAVAVCGIIFVFVATPSLPSGEYDHSAIDAVLESLIPQTTGADLVICCTTMPGYVASRMEQAEKKGYRLSYNPEFIAQGNVLSGLTQPDAILIGEGDTDAGLNISRVYGNICWNGPPIFRMSPTAAEVAKIALNCFLTIKISYANAIGDLLHRMECAKEVDVALQFIGEDSRIGHKFLRYGDGYGGPCLPRDNRALERAARAVGMKMPLSVAADITNEAHLREQFERIRIQDEVVFDGVAYKAGTDILEESQALKLALLVQGARLTKVKIRDRRSVIDQVRALHGEIFEYEVIE